MEGVEFCEYPAWVLSKNVDPVPLYANALSNTQGNTLKVLQNNVLAWFGKYHARPLPGINFFLIHRQQQLIIAIL